ncbi:NAD(P)-binding domain-containing protein [Actinomadura sp. 3N508]|uniref:NAD(P)-binding domain-containing protein n=1 Tax=Actinomadura sp. 3N508 TaxID=3375153 RepID=UPI0037916BEB
MTDVAVLGVGHMGAQIVRAVRQAGMTVAVWNRTPARAAALAGPQVEVHPTAAQAVAAAPVVLTCLLNYPATHEVIDAAADALPGKLVIQSSCGLPSDVDALAHRVETAGAGYLEAVLLCYPTELGTNAARVPHAGPQALLDAAQPLLDALRGGRYLGEDPRTANAYYVLGCTLYYAVIAGALAGAHITAASGIDGKLLSQVIESQFPSLLETAQDTGSNIETGRHSGEHNTLSVHKEALQELAR